MTTTTVNADQYIKDLNEISSISGSAMIPIQEESSTPESSTYHAKFSTVVQFLLQTFQPKIKTLVTQTSNWTISSSDSAKIFVLSDSGANTIQCTIDTGLSVGFECEIEDVHGKTITFVPQSSTEQIKSSNVGTNFELVSSALSSIRIRKITPTRWNIVRVT